MRWRSYVAVGDSFTEGMNDELPDGRLRGWADLVAVRLAQEMAGFRYANLAVRGRLFHQIVDEQVPAALRLRPDLVSFAGGGNDVLRRSFDPDRMLRRFDEVIGEFRAGGADVVIFRWADVTSRLPGKRVILPRMRILNQAVGEVAQKYGAIVVDLWHDPAFANPLLWSEDRLHMSTLGHQRVAAHVLAALGVGHEPQWLAAPPVPPARSWLAARAGDLRWARRHLMPWVKRRLQGRSSGDTLTAKRPSLNPVEGGP